MKLEACTEGLRPRIVNTVLVVWSMHTLNLEHAHKPSSLPRKSFRDDGQSDPV